MIFFNVLMLFLLIIIFSVEKIFLVVGNWLVLVLVIFELLINFLVGGWFVGGVSFICNEFSSEVWEIFVMVLVGSNIFLFRFSFMVV